jgi:hypothetical protein
MYKRLVLRLGYSTLSIVGCFLFPTTVLYFLGLISCLTA